MVPDLTTGCPPAGRAEEAALREALTLFTDRGAAAAAQITWQKMRLLGIR